MEESHSSHSEASHTATTTGGEGADEPTKTLGTGLRVIVLGGSGAVGEKSTKVAAFTTIGRRIYDKFGELDKQTQVQVDMTKMASDLKDADGNYTLGQFDVAIMTLGTTRADAGSSKKFREIDFTYCHEFAKICKDLGVKQYHLVSSTGADAKSWFLYPRTKGELEEATKALGFDELHIYRPGLLGRGDAARTIEKIFSIFGSLKVDDLAAILLSKVTAPPEVNSPQVIMYTMGRLSSELKSVRSANL